MGFSVSSLLRQRGDRHYLVQGQVSFVKEREKPSVDPGDCGTGLGKGQGQAGKPLPNISARWLPKILRGASLATLPCHCLTPSSRSFLLTALFIL